MYKATTQFNAKQKHRFVQEPNFIREYSMSFFQDITLESICTRMIKLLQIHMSSASSIGSAFDLK